MTDTLKPCRFCGDSRVYIEHCRESDVYHAECEYCGACGPRSDTDGAARSAWNQGVLARNRYGLVTDTRAI